MNRILADYFAAEFFDMATATGATETEALERLAEMLRERAGQAAGKRLSLASPSAPAPVPIA